MADNPGKQHAYLPYQEFFDLFIIQQFLPGVKNESQHSCLLDLDFKFKRRADKQTCGASEEVMNPSVRTVWRESGWGIFLRMVQELR